MVWPQGNATVLHGQDFQGMQQMLKEPSVESKWTAQGDQISVGNSSKVNQDPGLNTQPYKNNGRGEVYD